MAYWNALQNVWWAMKKGEAVSSPEPKPVEKAGESLEERAEEYVCRPIERRFDEQPTSITIAERAAALWGLKQGEEERNKLRAQFSEAKRLMGGHMECMSKAEAALTATQAKCEALEAELASEAEAHKWQAATAQTFREALEEICADSGWIQGGKNQRGQQGEIVARDRPRSAHGWGSEEGRGMSCPYQKGCRCNCGYRCEGPRAKNGKESTMRLAKFS